MYDVVIVGGGILGLATALKLHHRSPDRKLLVLEKEGEIATHQTGRNSGVLHSGIYYRPGSLKARLCRQGAAELLSFCDQNGIRYHLCGKVIVARGEEEIPRLEALYQRGRANGVEGLERVGPERLRELEPHARGVLGIHSPGTGIVDFGAVARRCAALLIEQGQAVVTGAEVHSIAWLSGDYRLETGRGEFAGKRVVNCAGLFADRLARMSGQAPSVQIVPFRGEYFRLRSERRHLVRNLIYPVPDPRFPFLGAHFTRTLEGEVEVGPNAVLALAREGYRWRDVSIKDLSEMVSFPGFWRMTARYWKTGLGELRRSLSHGAFARSCQRLIPELEVGDLVRARTGVRAQAVAPDGTLVDDFVIARNGNIVNVLNAPSPAATSAFAIAAEIVKLVEL